MACALDLVDIKKTYPAPTGRITILSGITLRAKPGEVIWLCGASGSGKSTMLNIAGLLAAPDAGTLSIAGRPATGLTGHHAARMRAETLGFVFQHHNLLGHLSAIDNIVLPALVTRRHARQQALTMLEELGLADRAHFLAHQLSGGERQRIAVARALINQPAVVLADEPISGLDPELSQSVLDQLAHAAGNGCAVVVASHDDTVARIADRIVTLANGRISDIEKSAGRGKGICL